MDAEQLHFPDFAVPDFAQPTLERADPTGPGFALPNPQRPEPAVARQVGPWPADLDRPDPDLPSVDSPDLYAPEVPPALTLPAPGEHALPRPEYAPDVVMRERPGEMAPAAAEVLLGSPDLKDLPAGLSYPQLYTSQDEMSTRKRHLGMLELGLERAAGGEQ
jgi:hypothetical protein